MHRIAGRPQRLHGSPRSRDRRRRHAQRRDRRRAPPVLAKIRGRVQGNYEYGPAPRLEQLFVSSDCATVGFRYVERVYLVDVASGRVGMLSDGRALRSPLP